MCLACSWSRLRPCGPLFRDYLRAHPEVALAYQAEKLRCRDLCPNDVQAYTDCKSDWIRATERAALAWRQASSDRPRS